MAVAEFECIECGDVCGDAVALIGRARLRHPGENALDLVRETERSIKEGTA